MNKISVQLEFTIAFALSLCSLGTSAAESTADSGSAAAAGSTAAPGDNGGILAEVGVNTACDMSSVCIPSYGLLGTVGMPRMRGLTIAFMFD